jgi:hypothetical protein
MTAASLQRLFWMVEIVLDGQSMISDDFFAQFFEVGFMPD